MCVWAPETPALVVPSPQEMVRLEPVTGTVIVWLAESVLQVVAKEVKSRVTSMVRQVLSFPNTSSPVAVTLAVYEFRPVTAEVMLSLLSLTISKRAMSPPVPMP